MEILQTIWNALTTENEIGVVIASIPLAFIESIVTTLLFTTILNIKSTKKQKTIYIICFSLIALVAIYFIPTPYNTIINIISCPILVYFIFKTNILKSILAEIIPYIIFVIISSLIVTFFVKITNFPSEYFLRVPLYKILISLTMYLIVYLLYYILKKHTFNITILDKMKKEHNFTLFINLIIRNYNHSFSIMYIYIIYK